MATMLQGNRCTIEQRGNALRITIPSPKQFSRILYLWVFIWMSGLFYFVAADEGGTRTFMRMFWLPILLPLAYLLLWLLFGQEEIEVGPEAIKIRHAILGIGWRQAYANEHISGIRVDVRGAVAPYPHLFNLRLLNRYGLATKGTGTIVFNYRGSPVRMGIGIDELEARLILAEIQRQHPGYFPQSPLEQKQEQRPTEDPVDLALHWQERGRPDRLQNADLKGADLRRARLGRDEAGNPGANLRSANLRGAKLGGADLRAVDLCAARLSGADLEDANLSWAKLCFSRLGCANLQRVNLEQANLHGVYLRRANLVLARLGGANLRDANLGAADLTFADLRKADLTNANLSGANLSGTNLSGATVSARQLRQTASLEGATLPDGTLHG